MLTPLDSLQNQMKITCQALGLQAVQNYMHHQMKLKLLGIAHLIYQQTLGPRYDGRYSILTISSYAHCSIILHLKPPISPVFRSANLIV